MKNNCMRKSATAVEYNVDECVKHHGDGYYVNLAEQHFKTLSPEAKITLTKYCYESYIDTNKDTYLKMGNAFFNMCEPGLKNAIVTKIMADFPVYEKQMQYALDRSKQARSSHTGCFRHFNNQGVKVEAYKSLKAWDTNAWILHELNPMIQINYPSMYHETKNMLGNLVNADLEAQTHRPRYGVRR